MSDFHPKFGSYSDHEDRIYRSRIQDLRNVYLEIKSEWKEARGINDEFLLNIPKIKVVCVSYIHLLKEYKTFHNDGNMTDNFKRSAYLSNLIIKTQPIELTDNKTADSMLLGINYHFAIKIYLYFLDIGEEGLENPVVQNTIKDLLQIYKREIPQKEIMVSLARCLEKVAA